jgi:hypothetical protein
LLHAVVAIAVSIQIVIRTDDVKLLCYLILIVSQAILVIAISLVFFPGRWINHKVHKAEKTKV